MKTMINKCVLAILFMITTACEQVAENSTESIILFDNTDEIGSKPDYSQIIKTYNLNKDIWQSINLSVSFLSNKDLSPSDKLSLESDNRLLASKQIRIAKIENFKRSLQKALTVDTTSTFEHSIIYRTIARNLNMLSKSKASKKHMIAFSDLMENGEISFYDKEIFSMIKSDPSAIQSMLEKDEVIGDLKGVEIWLIYAPKTYEQNNTYMIVANFYKDLLEAKGARVNIQQSFTQQP